MVKTETFVKKSEKKKKKKEQTSFVKERELTDIWSGEVEAESHEKILHTLIHHNTREIITAELEVLHRQKERSSNPFQLQLQFQIAIRQSGVVSLTGCDLNNMMMNPTMALFKAKP